ncbi:MAG TPA: response regulator [Myxococcales bacterium]|jgi:uncharacterized protein (TIGR02266 family)
MPEPSSALYDFAVFTYADALDRLPELLQALRERFGNPGPTIELFGRPETGEVGILFRFPFGLYSAALRAKMEREAGLLKSRMVEPSLLAVDDRRRFYSEKLGGCSAQATVDGHPKGAIDALREKMGLHKALPTLAVRFDTLEGLAEALAKSAAEGSLQLPRTRALAVGTKVMLALQSPENEPLLVNAKVVEPAKPNLLQVSVDMTAELEAFVGKIAAKAKEGRRRPEGGARKHPRYDTYLEVRFESGAHLCEEYARNIGRGGLFVRTEKPPPLRTQVRLRLKMPDGAVAETNAEVVHVVNPEEAKARRTSPGAGLAFATGDTLFQRAISQFVEGAGRKLRALIADDDERLRQVLGEALRAAGFEVETARDGNEAMAKLGASLFAIDLLLLDLDLPELDGYCLIDRVRRLGGELDLRIAVFSNEKDAQVMAQLVGPGGADAEIRRGTPLEEIVAKVKALLER